MIGVTRLSFEQKTQGDYINDTECQNIRHLYNYTDLQPKTSIDEISLLWLFRGCWTWIWY